MGPGNEETIGIRVMLEKKRKQKAELLRLPSCPGGMNRLCQVGAAVDQNRFADVRRLILQYSTSSCFLSPSYTSRCLAVLSVP